MEQENRKAYWTITVWSDSIELNFFHTEARSRAEAEEIGKEEMERWKRCYKDYYDKYEYYVGFWEWAE